MSSTSQPTLSQQERLQADKELMEKVQAYLRHRAPDAVLTQTFEEFHRTYSRVL
jgi:hypothetical protein